MKGVRVSVHMVVASLPQVSDLYKNIEHVEQQYIVAITANVFLTRVQSVSDHVRSKSNQSYTRMGLYLKSPITK